MKRTIFLTMLFLAMVSFARSQTPAVSLSLTITDDVGGNQDLSFGLDPSATAGLDTSLSETELPPFPPTGVFEARFIGDHINLSELGLGSYRDYRTGDETFVGEIVHEIKYQAGTGASQIEISWDFPENVTATLEDLFGGAQVSHAMSDSGGFVVTNLAVDKLKMTVSYDVATSVKDFIETVPREFHLFQNFPNPFNPSTNIRFALPEASHVLLSVFNIVGENVRTIIDNKYAAGDYSVRWDGKDNNGNSVSSGLYLYQLKVNNFTLVKRMSLLK